MASSDNSSVHEFFGPDKAREYNRQIRQSIPGYEDIYRMVHAFLANDLPDDAHVLVAGAGTGMELLFLGKHHPDWRFTAFDISAEMLSVCESCLDDAGLSNRVTLIHGSVDDVPAGETFDAATALLVSHFIIDTNVRSDFYTSLATRCKDAAPFLIADLVGDRNHPSFDVLQKAWWTYNVYNDRDLVELEEGFKKSDKVVSFLPEDTYCRMLSDAGFSVVQQFYRGLLFCGWFCRAEYPAS